MAATPLDSGSLADALIEALEPLPYPARMRELARRAREAARRGELAGLLRELSARGVYERRLAATAAAVGREDGYLRARLADPDALVRGIAVKAVERGHLSDDAVVDALHDAPAAVRRQVVRAVVAGRRSALADRLIDPFRTDWGDAEAVRLLAACGPATVVRLLPKLSHAVSGWTLLGLRHPVAVLDAAARQLGALPEAMRGAWWDRRGAGVAAAVTAEPERVLDLLERQCPGPLPARLLDRIEDLLSAAPGRTLRYLLAPERADELRRRGLKRSTLNRLIRLDPPELAELGRAMSQNHAALARLLKALPPSRRDVLFDVFTAGQDLSRVALDPALLAVLPHARRASEARRMAAQARERGGSWATVLTAVSFLPVGEAAEELTAATRRSAAEERAQAWPLLVRNAARSGEPARVTAMLGALERLRNEQDPVRSAALGALAETHPRLFTNDDAGVLERITTDAIEARDSSWQTRQALRTLAVNLLREHAVTREQRLIGWALGTLERLHGHTGGVHLGRLDEGLRRGQEHEVFEALRPWLEAGADKVDHTLTFALYRSLGRRARAMPQLRELLWQAILFGNDATVEKAVGYWLESSPDRDTEVTGILALEPSAAVLRPVLTVLTEHRTDLLDTVLGDTPPYGRFLVAGAPWVPWIGSPVNRWLPRHQAAAARLLARRAEDASLQTHERTSAIAQVAVIPELGAGVVRRFVRSTSVPLAEAALGALVWTDRPGEALPELLAHLGGDRARVAAYAATRATLYAEPSRLRVLLRAVLLPEDAAPTKVTSRKEAARLAATRLSPADAAALLADTYRRAGQHRDVQAACVAFATGLLDRDPAWELLEAAAGGGPEVRQAVLRAHPLDLADRHRARYARLVTTVCESADAETALRGFAALPSWAPWAQDAARALVSAVTDPDNRQTWSAATGALVALAIAEPAGSGHGDPLTRALTSLMAAAALPGEPDASPDRDQPARRRVRALAAHLGEQAREPSGAARGVAEAAGELLAGADAFVPDAAHILVNAVDPNAEPEVLTAALVRLVRLTEGRPALAVRTAKALRGRLWSAGQPKNPETLLPVAARLATADGYCAGLLAVVVTDAGGSRTGWPEPWREQLRLLRRHAHADVRDEALLLKTAPE
ncbi:hypothetical protein [Streptomyces sp. SPB162]|uniref:hypothetical protein n=1 Tax=Streptomyces sp. SPB162 TaxID=2940560 RepID=UPI002404E3FA|nr:hypothetical protein [Streptomyces sp. SPB162]MDF9816555.1 hypothetical protein [Streptomyces sp. SPB162]